MYKDVLFKKKIESGVNRGFMVCKNSMFTYINQERNGFSNYIKRKVLEDEVSTIPLNTGIDTSRNYLFFLLFFLIGLETLQTLCINGLSKITNALKSGTFVHR